jgi:hypothetical protein
MVGMRSDRARARARDLLATYYPVPDDSESQRLRQLAQEYVQEAERMDAENRGHAAESDELISAALDAVAKDYFAHQVARAKSRDKG